MCLCVVYVCVWICVCTIYVCVCVHVWYMCIYVCVNVWYMGGVCVYVQYGCICLYVHVLCVYVCFVHGCAHVLYIYWHWLCSAVILHVVFFCLSLKPEFTDWLASEALGSACLLVPFFFSLPVLGLQVHTITPWFYVGARNLSLGPHDFEADALLTNP